MSKSTTTARSSAATVRAWAQANGITEGFGSRGRFSPGLIKTFNAAHRSAPYGEGEAPTAPVEVKVLNARGARVTATVQVPTSETRAWALAQGLTVSAKGKVPASLVAQHAQALAVAQGRTLAPVEA